MTRTLLVLKFGGTSLGKTSRVRRAALRVRAQIERGFAPVVVVSATGSTTDRVLRRLVRLGTGPATLSPREVDRALATGEDLAAALLAAALNGLGVPARSMRGGEAGVRVTGRFGAGEIAEVIPDAIGSLSSAGVVPVISGFQGCDESGETLTLGRGGSDTSAVAIAAALGSVPCHIITDVAAVYDADPNLVEEAAPLEQLTHGALLTLVESGARVVHPAAARLAATSGVPLHVYHYAARPGREGGTRVEPETVPLPIAV